MAVMYRDRDRAESFGADAERYDRARPSYPAGVIDDLTGDAPSRVLDVGCGTGIAARLFMARGCEVVGVEPDSRMAAVARAHGVTVEVANFETWDPAGRQFDLIVSGQAWHWIDPRAGPAKGGAVLRPGGRLAAFWNWGHYDEQVKAALDDVYPRFAPALRADSAPRGTPRDGRPEADVVAAWATGLFTPAQVRHYAWEQRYSTAQWLDQLVTHSDHLLLPAAELSDLVEAVGGVIDRLGGSVTMHYDTTLVSAERLP
jgi:SAM-dependent methyltransferase